MNNTQDKLPKRHPLQSEFVQNKLLQGNHENMEKDYGKMGRLETEEELKNHKNWASDNFKKMKLGDNFYDKENLAPEVDTVFFTFPEAAKKKTIFQGFEFAQRQVKMNKEKGDKSQANLFIPQIVQIDYSEYSDIPMFENNIHAQPYKDGILLVTDVEKGNRMCLALGLGIVDKSPSVDCKVVATIFQSKFRNHGQIDWTSKNFDNQLVFYVVVPKIIKNKAARIVFKNNISANRLIKLFRSNSPRKLPTGDFRHFFDKTTNIQDILVGIYRCQEDEKKKQLHDYNNYPKHSLLQASYRGALIECSNYCIVAKDHGYGPDEFYTHIEKYKNKSLEEIKQEYMRDIFPFEKDLEISIIQNTIWSNKEKNKTLSAFFHKNLLKMVIFYYHTKEGTTLCNGVEINPEKKSSVDCLLFWKKINLFELLFNILNKKNFPLCTRNSQIINDVDIFDPVLNCHISLSDDSFLGKKPEAIQGNNFGKMKFEFKYKHVLKEAVSNPTGYLVPYDGVFELLHDPFFKCIRFREEGDLVTAVILDKNERYFIEVFSKTEVDFKYMLWNQMKFNKNYSEECIQEIYKKIATVIRDCHVLIDRERTMGGGGKRRPYGMNTDSEYNIYYYPRKRYRYKNNTKAEKDFFRETRKFNGTRVAHLRRLPADYAPSNKQKLLAKSLDWHVPPGHTFVKETDWGVKMTKREIRYRNTCLNDVFYYDNKEVSEAQKINQLPDGMAFEEYCQDYVKKLGYSTKRRQNHDGGIDIRATKILDNGETEYLIVQCKHWNTPVSPGAMKEFKASCDEEQSEYKKVKIFMTSNKFSPGAREYAEKYNIKLIDGSDLLK